MTIVVETHKIVNVIETHEITINTHDTLKGNDKQKHGGKSKGKGVVDVVAIVEGKVKMLVQGLAYNNELVFVIKRRKKKVKVVEHQTL